MQDVPDIGADPERREFLQALALFDAPAYIRRARGAEQAQARLLERCRAQRDDWLAMPRLRLATLRALAGGWEALAPFVADTAPLERLHRELAPVLRSPVAPASSARRLRRAVQDYAASAERFNRRWSGFVAALDLAGLNALRDGYNRYYVVEKACALRSDLLARQGFEPLPPLSPQDLLREMPLLPVIVPPSGAGAAAPR